MHLERLAAILETVGQVEAATVADICAHVDLPRPSAYRLVQDLVAVGLLEPVARGRFALGARLRRIADGAQSDRALLAAIAPVLRQGAARHGAAFFLSRLRGRSVEIVHVETPDTGVSYLHPGLGRRPLHACSCAKAIAAFCPDRLPVAEMAGRMRAYTEATTTDPDVLLAEFATIRARGYAECVEEIERGMCSVAVPLSRAGPGATMAIGATGSVRVLTAEVRARIAGDLRERAEEIAAATGLDAQPAAQPPSRQPASSGTDPAASSSISPSTGQKNSAPG